MKISIGYGIIFDSKRVWVSMAIAVAALWPQPGWAASAGTELMRPGSPPPVLVVSSDAPAGVKIAVGDLAVDFEEATGRKAEIVSTPPRRRAAIVIRVAEPGMADFQTLEGKWESFVIRPVGKGTILVVGSDVRGTMYGVYELSERLLGTDPLKLWTGRVPERTERVSWTDGVVREGSPSFKYRGLFINDEDSLMGWKGEEINADIGPEAYAEIFETISRLKGNLIAPGMYANRMDPKSRQLCNDRGIYYTASHLELLLANPQRYWKPYSLEHWGEELDYSFSEHPKKLKAFWQDSIREHEGFLNIWPVGLRGITDFAFWVSDKSAPTTPEGRARIVDQAIQSQYELLDETLPPPDLPLTSLTLYEELAGLFNTGEIHLRDDTLLVWCDAGYIATMLELPSEKLQENPGGNGVYFHLANCDKQWTQWVPLEHLQSQFQSIIKHRANQYALFNVGDIREVLPTMNAAMDLVWNSKPWMENADESRHYLEDWVGYQFGEESRSAIAELYRRYYDLETPNSSTYVIEWLAPSVSSRNHYPLWYATSAFRFVEETGNRPDLLKAYAGLRDFPKMYQRREKITEAHLRETATPWDVLYTEALQVMSGIPKNRQSFFFDNFVLHIQTSRLVNHWALNILQAFGKLETGDFSGAADAFGQAAGFMETLVVEREKASHGKWKNWFRGEYHNGWDLNLWTLHPQWHAEDARRLAEMAIAADREKDATIIVDGRSEKEEGSFPVTFTLPDDYDAAKLKEVRLCGWVYGKTRPEKELTLQLNGKEFKLAATDGTRNPFYGVEIDPALLKPGINRLSSQVKGSFRWSLCCFPQ